MFVVVVIIISARRDTALPLLAAARFGDAQVVRRFLELGADVNGRSGAEGLTALHGASSRQVVSLLLLADADPTLAATDGRTPLHHAAALRDVAVIRLLLSAGAPVDARTTQAVQIFALTLSAGATPLHVAAVANRGLDVVRTLVVDAKADLLARDADGLSPAAVFGRPGTPAAVREFVETALTANRQRADDASQRAGGATTSLTRLPVPPQLTRRATASSLPTVIEPLPDSATVLFTGKPMCDYVKNSPVEVTVSRQDELHVLAQLGSFYHVRIVRDGTQGLFPSGLLTHVRSLQR